MFKKAKENKKGFTLAELLIVVAIIAVLVAISIPIFTSQLEKAREATDVANIRSAYAEAAAEAITAEVGSTITKSTNKMQSSGAIDKIASESVGPWESSKITITAGTAATVTATVGDNGNTTFALSGGATVANYYSVGGN